MTDWTAGIVPADSLFLWLCPLLVCISCWMNKCRRRSTVVHSDQGQTRGRLCFTVLWCQSGPGFLAVKILDPEHRGAV